MALLWLLSVLLGLVASESFHVRFFNETQDVKWQTDLSGALGWSTSHSYCVLDSSNVLPQPDGTLRLRYTDAGCPSSCTDHNYSCAEVETIDAVAVVTYGYLGFIATPPRTLSGGYPGDLVLRIRLDFWDGDMHIQYYSDNPGKLEFRSHNYSSGFSSHKESLYIPATTRTWRTNHFGFGNGPLYALFEVGVWLRKNDQGDDCASVILYDFKTNVSEFSLLHELCRSDPQASLPHFYEGIDMEFSAMTATSSRITEMDTTHEAAYAVIKEIRWVEGQMTFDEFPFRPDPTSGEGSGDGGTDNGPNISDEDPPGLSTDVLAAIIAAVIVVIVLVFVMTILIILIIVIILKRNSTNKNNPPTPTISDFDQELTAREEEDSNQNQASLQFNSSLFQIPYTDLDVKNSIGQGGSSAVIFKARYAGKWVAFKCFRVTDVQNDENRFDEFEKEVGLLGSLAHPHILRCYGACLALPRVGIVMEFAEKGDLKCFIQTEIPSIDVRIRLCYEVAQAFVFLHNRKILHRDLKPENVLISDQSEAKLCDFGISRLIESNSSSKTRAVGTSDYMAPELYSGDYGFPVDVFSFGILLWTCLTGEFKPYAKSYGSDIFRPEVRVASDPTFRPSIQMIEDDEAIPGWCGEMMVSCWSHEPSERPTFEVVCERIEGEMKQQQGGRGKK